VDAARGVVQRSGRQVVLPRGNGIRLLRALYDAYPRTVRIVRLVDALYADHPDGGPDSDRDSVRVAVCKIRPPLIAIGVRVVNEFGEGYRLEFEPFEDMEKAA
jgi:hypothetical protein